MIHHFLIVALATTFSLFSMDDSRKKIKYSENNNSTEIAYKQPKSLQGLSLVKCAHLILSGDIQENNFNKNRLDCLLQAFNNLYKKENSNTLKMLPDKLRLSFISADHNTLFTHNGFYQDCKIINRPANTQVEVPVPTVRHGVFLAGNKCVFTNELQGYVFIEKDEDYVTNINIYDYVAKTNKEIFYTKYFSAIIALSDNLIACGTHLPESAIHIINTNNVSIQKCEMNMGIDIRAMAKLKNNLIAIGDKFVHNPFYIFDYVQKKLIKKITLPHGGDTYSFISNNDNYIACYNRTDCHIFDITRAENKELNVTLDCCIDSGAFDKTSNYLIGIYGDWGSSVLYLWHIPFQQLVRCIIPWQKNVAATYISLSDKSLIISDKHYNVGEVKNLNLSQFFVSAAIKKLSDKYDKNVKQ